MKVSIINMTAGALELLLFTKQTRLNLSPAFFEEICEWPEEKKRAELDYMSKTIKSSWEFIDVVFLIEGVTRATAQQITRTRNASYAMQSQRVNDVRDFGVTCPFEPRSARAHDWDLVLGQVLIKYGQWVDEGVPLEDARGILPMNSQCNLVAKYNMRALTDVVKSRRSLRAQGEYTAIAEAMERETLLYWPWAAPFFKDDREIALKMLEDIAKELGITTGKGPGWEIGKAIDLIRKGG